MVVLYKPQDLAKPISSQIQLDYDPFSQSGSDKLDVTVTAPYVPYSPVLFLTD